MGRLWLRGISAVAIAIAAAVPARGARADGLPVLGVDAGSTGVASDADGVRYLTFTTPRGSILARVGLGDARVRQSAYFARPFVIPAVAYDGSAAGLSADGRTLVLIRPRRTFPQATTHLAALDANRLRVRRFIALHGDFSFDAISPGGNLLYLIEYTSASDPTRYAVRAYDLRGGRLLPKPIVDPTEAGEAMRGSPLTRASSPDGRWAYTLYDGSGKEPFLHALDTAGRTARCVDLDALAGRQDLGALRLDVGDGGRRLTVRRGARALAVVDTRTFNVQTGGPSASRSTSARDLPRRAVWAGLAAAGLLIVGCALTLALRRRRAVLTAG
jgi:hypothetical protein